MIDMELWKQELDKLPHGKSTISWKNSIGYELNFIYDNIQDKIKILTYHNKKVLVQWKNNTQWIKTDGILKCQLGNLLGIYCSKKPFMGVNDMWTTNPNLASLLANKEDGYKYTQNSNQRTNWKCPICGEIINNKNINKINIRGLSCPRCSDGVSYPEKIMYSILQELNIEFKYQYKPTWCTYKMNGKNKIGRYDFYFELNNKEYIIEMDGELGHGNKVHSKDTKTKEETKQIDDIKDRLANEHNIIVIRIDCKKSDLEYIKKHIIDSELNNLFNLSNIDWLKCEEFALSSLVKKACDLWNNQYTINDISKKIKVNKNTIIRYLKKGSLINLCKYTPNSIKAINFNKKQIICLNTKQIFNSINKAKKYYNIKSDHIGQCCKGERKYSGINQVTKEYLQYQYYEDYLTKPKRLLSNEEIDNNYKEKFNKAHCKKVFCLNNNKTFNSIKEASIYYNISSGSSIIVSCKNECKSAGKDPVTKEPLRWMYYEDYLQIYKKVI